MDDKAPRAKISGPLGTNAERMAEINNPPPPGAVGLSPATSIYSTETAHTAVVNKHAPALDEALARRSFGTNLRDAASMLSRATVAAGNTVLDLALVGGDTAAMGQTPVIAGGINVLTGGLTAGGGSLVERYTKGFEQQRDAVLDSRADLGVGGSLVADVGGGLVGWPRMLDKVVTDSILSAAKNTGWLAKAGRVVRDGLSGAFQSLAQTENYRTENDSDMDRLGTALFGFAAGAGSQAVFGDAILPNLKTSALDKNVAGSFLNRGPSVGGGRAADVADAVSKLPAGAGIFDTNLEGFGKNNILIRGANALNELIIPDLGNVVGGAEQRYLTQFYRAMDAVQTTFNQMNADATRQFDNLVAGAKSPTEVATALAPRYAPIKSEMSGYSVTEVPPGAPPGSPLPKGATPVDMLQTSAALRKKYLASLRIVDESASPGAMKAWNAFNDLIRTKEVERGAGGLRKVVSDGKAKALDARVLSPTSNLATLYNARMYLAQTVQPGALSTSAERMHAREVFKLLDIVDEEIAVIAGKGPGEARTAYAKIKAIEDMDMIGAASYNNRGLLTDPEARRFYTEDIEEVKARIAGDPELLAAFQNGAKRAMREDVRQNGYAHAITHKLGTVGDYDNPSFLTSKTGALDELTWMFGDAHMREVVDLYNTTMQGAPAVERLSRNLGVDNLARAGSKFDEHVANDAINAAASRSTTDKVITYMTSLVKNVNAHGVDARKMLLMLEVMGNSPEAAQRIGAAAKTLAKQNIEPVAGTIGSALANMVGPKNRGPEEDGASSPIVTAKEKPRPN